nr:ABC transporter substrate-binding protein [Tissierella sp.]
MKTNKKVFSRSMLIIVLAFVMIFVTACGDSDKDKGPDKPDSAGNSQAVFAGGWPYETVPTGHFNMFIANAIDLKYFRELHQLPLATYRADTEEYIPMLAESWELADDKKSMKLTLRDDVEWRSGEKFTSKDVVATFLTYRLVGDSVWNYIDKVEAISDNEVEFNIQEGTTMLYRYILRKPMVDHATYGEYSDKLAALIEDGKDNTSSEWESLVNDFTNFRPEIVNATGPYYLDPSNVSQSNVKLAKNDKSFLADKVNFDEVLVYNGDVADLTPLVLNKEVDYLTHQFPSASMESFKQAGYNTIQLEGSDGIGLYINQDVKPLDKKEVRQALAHIIDRNRVAEFALPGVTRGTKYLSGLGDQMTEDWVESSKLIEYDVNADKASKLLESVGLTKKGDTWQLEDGKEFTLSLQAPSSWSDAATAANEISQQLTAFGIKTTFDGIDPNSRQANIDDGKYDLALSFFGTGKPHAAFAFETALLLSNANVSKGLSYPMVQETEIAGKVDLEKLIKEATEGWDEELQKEKVEKIVYTINETVPYIPIYTKWSNNLSSSGMRTDWGSDDGLYLNSAGDDNFTVLKILNGELKPINK